MTSRHQAKRLLERATGVRVYRELPHGVDLHHDLCRLDASIRLIVDVGANVGQAALRFREAFPHAVIHCFEPVRDTFARLERNAGRYGCHCHPCAMGSHAQLATIYVRSNDTMSSLSKPEEYVSSEEVEVRTLDNWTRENAIDFIDVLKIDTEGHDLEVLAGAARLLESCSIRFIITEVGFDPERNLVPFDSVRPVLGSYGLSLVGLYHQTMDWGGKRRLLFADALFARPG